MTARTVYFTAPGEVVVREEPISPPSAGELRIDALVSAISPGTELLVYHGDVPTTVEADESIDALDGSFEYPLQYGYATVGRVTEVGDGVDPAWRDELVFAFHPHASAFVVAEEAVHALPADCPPERAVFLANLETAIGLVMDGRPKIGERVTVFGQGVIGLLTTALLAEFPLSRLVTVEPHATRRGLSERLGADESIPPDSALDATLDDGGGDLAYELSGRPDALDTAIQATGYGGRVVIGSWYGAKRADLDLGGSFHRSHIRLRSSQVSTIDPDHTGRWDKDRRLELAWRRLRTVEPRRLVTHRLPVEEAPNAYRLLDESPNDVIQVLLTY